MEPNQPLVEGHSSHSAAHDARKAQEGPSTIAITPAGLSKSLEIMAMVPSV
jgi:hypothetical protein